jgi:glycerophosphoryl diester phosphodiesterase
VEALHAALFRELRVEGVFTDFPDVTLAWVRQHGGR